MVIAASGQYEEYRERNVIAFTHKGAADTFAALAQVWVAEATGHCRDLDIEWHDRDRWLKQNPNPFDAEWDFDTTYHVGEVPVWEEGSELVEHVFKPKRFRKSKDPSEPHRCRKCGGEWYGEDIHQCA